MTHDTVNTRNRAVREDDPLAGEPVDTTTPVPAEPARSRRIVSPQEFYAEITKRPDVSELLRRLAR